MSENEEIKDIHSKSGNPVASTEDTGMDMNELKSKAIKYAGLLAIVVIIAGYFYISSEQSNEENFEANIMLERVMPFFEKGDYGKALEGDQSIVINGQPLMGLREIAEKYSGNETSKLASLYAGNAYKLAGDLAAAKSWYDKAVSSSSNVVRIGALTGLAYCEEANGNYDVAAKNYKEAVTLTKNEEMKARLGFFAGYCLEKAGQNEVAKEQYASVVEKSKEERESEFVSKAKQGIARLGTKIE